MAFYMLYSDHNSLIQSVMWDGTPASMPPPPHSQHPHKPARYTVRVNMPPIGYMLVMHSINCDGIALSLDRDLIS